MLQINVAEDDRLNLTEDDRTKIIRVKKEKQSESKKGEKDNKIEEWNGMKYQCRLCDKGFYTTSSLCLSQHQRPLL